MRVRKLTLENFRGFKQAEVSFGRGRVTVLAGINGSGKSSILDALAALFEELGRLMLVGFSEQSVSVHQFVGTDVHDGEKPLRVELTTEMGGEAVSWNLFTKTLLTVDRIITRSSEEYTTAGQLARKTDALRSALQANRSSAVPFAVIYRTNRAVLDVPLRIRGKRAFDQLSVFDDALEERSNDFRSFFEWFRDREDLENERMRESQEQGKAAPFGGWQEPQLQAVRSAIEGLLPGFRRPRIRREPLRMTVEKDGRELVIGQLSDGEKCLLAMAGDLSRRLAVANPASGTPNECEALVLIDEIELHLHPAWQREVVRRLAATFPGCQFIVTTHSPQVLGEVAAEDVVVIERFQPFAPGAPTKGRDTNAILTQVMKGTDRSEEASLQIASIGALLDESKLPEARVALDELARVLSDADEEVIRLRTHLHFLES